MNKYQTMTQYQWDRAAQVWRPIAAWVFREGEEIHVRALAGHEAEVLPFSAAVEWAGLHDFPPEITWEYWSREWSGHPQAGDHLGKVQVVEAPDWETAAGLVLQKAVQPPT